MRFIKNIMSRKPEADDLAAPIDADMEDVAPLRRKARDPEADDTGFLNASRMRDDASSAQQDKLAEAQRLFGLKSETGGDLPDPAPMLDPAPEADDLFADDDWDDDWEDEDWGDEWKEADADGDAESHAAEEKAHLVNDIREAMGAMSHIAPEERVQSSVPALMRNPAEKNWSEDEEFGRKALARNHLTAGGSEDRLLEETEGKFGEEKGSRRRSAMAHLKAAAKATKADRILSSTVGRDPSSDPAEQSPYRADLAKVVKPRPVTRPTPETFSPSETLEDIAAAQDEAAPWMDGDLDFSDPAATDQFGEFDAADGYGDDATDALDDGATDAATDTGVEADAEPAVPEKKRTRMLMNADEENMRAALRDDDHPAAAPRKNIWDMDAADPDPADTPAHATPDREAAALRSPVSTPRSKPRPGPRGLSALSPQHDPATQPTPVAGGGAQAPVSGLGKMPVATGGRAGRGAGRVKTRLLGFQGSDQGTDVFAAAPVQAEPEVAGAPVMFPVGWIVVVDGPGRGASFSLVDGVSQIGRGEDQAIKLDFGDTAISRHNHAAVAFDNEQSKFFLGHGGKSNLVRINDRPVLSTEELNDGDRVRIGETTLLFVALCTDDFGWTQSEGDGADHAALA